MQERMITRKQVICCLQHGRFVEDPYRSMRGNWEMSLAVLSAGDPLKVVCALDNGDTGNYIIVITAI